ncbi:gliding motility lipoprotein GldB [Zhouia spongiae]|uniref:Gliding motility lipoprotein GldB n=1 Tax=Zhouia spongiae TaxID=2202721 RepID=A0ABY3YN76_9FLAO|nr:gliding motility lipoprotein GldB [Zhouia spongiae]UNY99103.1 gliding motility lipoprotein GldB [Zhouia spongiae]
MKRILGVFFAIIIWSCGKENKPEEEISKIEVSFNVERFDKALSGADVSNLPGLKSRFPLLFPESYPDSIWVKRLNDTLQAELVEEVGKVYPDFKKETDQLHSLFQHASYYLNDFTPPDVITLTTEVDYRNSVIYADSLLLIGLDNYLGKDHKFYTGIQEYLKRDFEPDLIVVDAASKIARSRLTLPSDRTFLAAMILYGKELYLKDLLIPFKTDAEKIKYTEKQIQWARNNETNIWRHLVDNNALFSTDQSLKTRFIEPAPFSKFYLSFDAESPGRIGQYVGWQIVRSYMENNDVSLQQMLKMSTEEIFNNSRYKPGK